MFDSFYRSGALVFGGGHVVLPLLEREVVPSGWVSKETFLSRLWGDSSCTWSTIYFCSLSRGRYEWLARWS